MINKVFKKNNTRDRNKNLFICVCVEDQKIYSHDLKRYFKLFKIIRMSVEKFADERNVRKEQTRRRS